MDIASVILSSGVVLMGGLLAAFGVGALVSLVRFALRSVRATATVMGRTGAKDGRRPLVEFTDESGTTRCEPLTAPPDATAYEIGDTVRVRYARDNPAEVRPAATQLRTAAVVFLCIGVAVMACGALMLVFKARWGDY